MQVVFLMFSMLLVGMVSSKTVRSEPETITRSGLSDDVERFVGIVAGGLLQALRLRRWAYSLWVGLRTAFTDLTIAGKTESCRQVYLPWFRAVEQPFRIRAVVGFGHKQRGHFGSVWIFHLHRFRRVGRQSAYAFNMKHS